MQQPNVPLSQSEQVALKLASCGSLLFALGVAFGAFGAHGLKNMLTPEVLAVFEKAVFYHLLHAGALILLPFLPLLVKVDLAPIRRVWLILCLGLVLFSGSLYVYSISGIRGFAMITPFGGTLFIGGWVYLAATLFQGALPRDSQKKLLQ